MDYAIEARFRLTKRAGPEDNLRKFEEMFERRLSRGQFHYQPYLGCREFTAIVEPYSGDPAPIAEETRDLGFMLQDIRYGTKQNVPVFFHAKLEHGILAFPSGRRRHDSSEFEVLAEREHLLDDPDYEPKPVAWIIALDSDGRFLNVDLNGD